MNITNATHFAGESNLRHIIPVLPPSCTLRRDSESYRGVLPQCTVLDQNGSSEGALARRVQYAKMLLTSLTGTQAGATSLRLSLSTVVLQVQLEVASCAHWHSLAALAVPLALPVRCRSTAGAALAHCSLPVSLSTGTGTPGTATALAVPVSLLPLPVAVWHWHWAGHCQWQTPSQWLRVWHYYVVALPVAT